MFNGEIHFTALALSQHITFPRLAASPLLPSVAAIELECLGNGDEVSGFVRVTEVATQALGVELARGAIEGCLDRLTHDFGTTFEEAEIRSSQFTPVDPASNTAYLGSAYMRIQGGSLRAIRGLQPEGVRSSLEGPARQGERHFTLYRMARRSRSPVEEFVHLYSILLLLCGESQGDVETFIRQARPGIATTMSPTSPKHPRSASETIYTRLRNELAHRRDGVDLAATKQDIEANVDGLRAIVRDAMHAFP